APVFAKAAEQRPYRGLPEMRAAFLSQDPETALFIEGLAIGPVRNQHVVCIGDRKDARLERDLIAAQPARVAAAVHSLVMGDDDLRLVAKPVDARENCLAEFRMP